MTVKKVIGRGGGGKGGGGGQHVPSEASDSLQSKSSAKIIDLISEGEIDGLANGLKSVFLDGTPVENANGTFNFSGVNVETRNGTQSQEYILGFTSIENENSVAVDVTYNNPIVRTITNETVDAVVVKISIPQLTYQNPSSGDLGGSEVNYTISLQSNGAGYVEKVNDTVIGKTTSKYERSYRVDLEGDGPWDIKITRVTVDAVGVETQNITRWESYTEVIDGKLNYPNSALVAIEIDAQQFNSIPTRGYEVKGLKIKVPSNCSTRADGSLTYSGIWDGTFTTTWSSNPAWIFYDLLTTERYGLGSFVPESHVDRWSLYTIGKYCDELVDDGFGGTEPRFSCNLYLQTRVEAYKMIQDLASTFQGMAYWSGGTIVCTQDSPEDPAFLFTPANVIDGLFTYQGTSAKARHTVAEVTYNDPTDMYRQKIEYVEDTEAIARYGIIETSIAAFGCTSRGQANRVGRWVLYSERYQTETVIFKAGLEGALCRPGDIIKIADPTRAGSRRGGRILAATDTTISVDDTSFNIDPSTNTLSVMLQNGTVETRDLLTASNGELVVTSPFSLAPTRGSVWCVQSATVDIQYFKIISIRESDNGAHEISALAHDPRKYDVVEDSLVLETRSFSDLSAVPDAPTGLVVTETLYESNGQVRVKVSLSWNIVPRANEYIVLYSRDGNNITQLPSTKTPTVELFDADPGLYTFTVYALSPLGVRSSASTITQQILGKAFPPNDVSGFSLIPNAGVAYLSWEKATDLDVLIGGSVRIRYSPLLTDVAWRDTVDITPALAGSATRAQVPLMAGTYMAKFVDSSGHSSDNAASIVTTIPIPLSLNVVDTVTESPTFSGTPTNMEVSTYLDGLTLRAGTLIDDIPDIDSLASFDFAGGVSLSGSYDFANVVDLTEVYSSRVTTSIQAESVDVRDVWDYRTDDIDNWIDLDGDFIDDVNAELFVSTTLDDPNSMGATWTDWKRFFVGEYTARGFKFQLRATSASPDHTIVIKALSVTIDMPDRTVNLKGLVSGAALYSVAYDYGFAAEPAIGITAYNMNSGDYCVISNKTRSGFDIIFRNSGATAVSRTFDVMAKGYGRQAV